jgi:cytochrome c
MDAHLPRTAVASVVAAIALVLAQGYGAPARAEKRAADEGRGRLLYETACIACHTTQAHWRDKSIVRSWPELLYQVDRWQRNAGQKWISSDIVDVAAHLNNQFYKLPCPVSGCGPREVSRAGR